MSGARPRAGRGCRASVAHLFNSAVMPRYHTLADVDSTEALEAHQEKKRAYKAQLKTTGGTFDSNDAGQPKGR